MKLLVAGARGLGAHLARHFAGRGWEVTVAARTRETVERLAQEIGGRGVVCDLAEPSALRGEYDLVIAAQTSDARFAVQPVLEAAPDQLLARFVGYPVNSLKLLQAVAPAMAARRSGCFVQIGTTLAPRPRAGFGAMHAAQHALRALMAAAADELKERGVHVAYLAVEGQLATAASAGWMERHGADRAIPPDEVARAVEYLLAQDPRAWTHELALRPAAS